MTVHTVCADNTSWYSRTVFSSLKHTNACVGVLQKGKLHPSKGLCRPVFCVQASTQLPDISEWVVEYPRLAMHSPPEAFLSGQTVLGSTSCPLDIVCCTKGSSSKHSAFVTTLNNGLACMYKMPVLYVGPCQPQVAAA